MSFAQSLIEDHEFVTDFARYSEGLMSEVAIRKKYHFNEETWERLGVDNKLIEAVEAEKVRRIRSGEAKREKAQQHIVKAPDVLNGIMSDPKANARHRIDSAKALDDLAGFAPQRPAAEQDRVIIHIDMGADTRAKGLESNPAEVLHIEASARPNPDPNGAKLVDAIPQPIPYQEEVVPPRRGPGRPPGSRNKPKVIDERPKGVPGFDVG